MDVVVAFFPTSCRRAGWWFLELGGRPGPGREGLGGLAGRVVFGRRLRNPRWMRAGVGRCGSVAGFSHGRRRSWVRWCASRSWVWAAMMIQVQRSPWSGVRIRGRVQPRVCLRNSESVLQIEAAQEGSPQTVQLRVGELGAGVAQPDRFGAAITRQPLDLEPDDAALDEG